MHSIWPVRQLADRPEADAANDVCASVKIYLALMRRQPANLLEPRDFCCDLVNDSEAVSSVVPLIEAPDGENVPYPSQLRALEKFAAGMTAAAIAIEGGIKLSTIQ